jgi:hypothetical protein
MTSPSSWYSLARECRMRAAEARAHADELNEPEPKAIMLRIAADYEKVAEWAEKTQYLGGTRNGVCARASSVFAMRSSDCEIVSRLRETVSCRSHCSRRKSRRLFRIEARMVSRSFGKCNGWSGIAALPSQGGSAIGLSATDALAEPQPVMNDNLHHLSRFHTCQARPIMAGSGVERRRTPQCRRCNFGFSGQS